MTDLGLRRRNQSAELMSALITVAWWNYIPGLQSFKILSIRAMSHGGYAIIPYFLNNCSIW